MLIDNQYIGTELELFQYGDNWKNYYKKHLQPYIKGDVLEVGAGIGGTTKNLVDIPHASWTCLEPDAQMVAVLNEKVAEGSLPKDCKVVQGISSSLPKDKLYDSILYIDVIEHIEDDKAEMATIANYLKPGGHLIVLVPAHQSLYSEFDKAIGHYRRYNKAMLKAAIPTSLHREKLMYLDTIGLVASFANKLLLKQKAPTLDQIKFWDNYIIRVSKVIDPLLFHSMGKTVVGVWRK